jgi:transcriptional regulator
MTNTAGAGAYPPGAFRESRAEVLTDFIRTNPFGQLVTQGPDGLQACGLPVVLKPAADGFELNGHLARANPQAQVQDTEALVIFQGPHAYVRPAWYETKRLTGRAVPTWDYITVYAKGRLTLMDEPAWLRSHLDALSAQQEGGFEDPWSPADAPADYVDGLLRAIVGLRIEAVRLEGVWKLNQNHPRANRQGVVDGLLALGGDDAAAIAQAILAREAQD